MRGMKCPEGFGPPRETAHTLSPSNPLDTSFVEHHERSCISPHAPPDGTFHRWLTVEQIRKMERMRRESVLVAMLSGELPYEQRGRIRYARLSDVLAWEERRLQGNTAPSRRAVAPELEDLAD